MLEEITGCTDLSRREVKGKLKAEGLTVPDLSVPYHVHPSTTPPAIIEPLK
jgi:hypothetical protein